MLFSVLIAHYNNSRFLTVALNSVLNQTYTNWEVILVDDGSTDEFEQVVAAYTAEPRIKIYRSNKNYGCGHAKRKCAEYATGQILAFLDPDDALEVNALEIMVKAHIEKPDCSIINSTHYICDEQLNSNRIAGYPRALPNGTPYLLLSDGRIHHFASFKKDCYDRTAGISASNKKAVDQDLYYKLEETGDVFFIDLPLYYYRIHKGSISNAGKEAEATLWHYAIIEEACLRRIQQIKEQQPVQKKWIKIYRTRYYKIKAFRSYRTKSWFTLAGSLFLFPFVGGMGNLISYFKKLPKEGDALFKKSFSDNYEIKA